MENVEIFRVVIQFGLMGMAFHLGVSKARKELNVKLKEIRDNVDSDLKKFFKDKVSSHAKGLHEVTYPYEGAEIKGYMLVCTKRQHYFASLLLPNGTHITFGTFNGKEIKDVFSMERADKILEEELLEFWNKESYDVE